MDEKMKQQLKQAAQSACSVLKTVWQEIKKVTATLHNDYVQRQQIQMNQIQQDNSVRMLNQIRWELFCVFHDRKYPYLEMVHVVEDIVPFRPYPPQVGILLESRETPPLSYVLRQVRDKMNYDIQCFRQWILANYTLEEAWRLFPCIMAGMYIAEITANGIYAILTVAFPQK